MKCVNFSTNRLKILLHRNKPNFISNLHKITRIYVKTGQFGGQPQNTGIKLAIGIERRRDFEPGPGTHPHESLSPLHPH